MHDGNRAMRCCVAATMIAAMVGCAGPKPPPVVRGDPELERTNASAQAAFERGILLEAATLYEQSLARARVMDQPLEIGDAAYNLAACLAAMNQLDRARVLLREAAWDLTRAGAGDDDVILMEARVARRQGQLDEAMSLTATLVAPPVAKRSPILAAQAHLLRSELACERHDLPAARQELEAAQSAAGKSPDPSLSAGIADAAGRVAMEEHRPAEAAAKFDHAVILLQRAGAYAEMGWALGWSGEAHLAAGRPDAAADRFYRAARSTYARGNSVKARELLARALTSAQAAKLAGLSEQAHALASEMDAATRPAAP
jgi:tetratricopeptide (TPR) repeat protein